ncbi:MAG: transposase [Spirochaetales bacterium]|nr:transposase [Spirochaetales bacterium]
MKGKRYSEEQIIGMLREIETGTSVADVCRKHGVSAWSISRWRRKYSGMDVPEAKRLKALEAENARLKRIVANQALDMEILKEAASKKW